MATIESAIRRATQRWVALGGLVWRMFCVVAVIAVSLSWLRLMPALLGTAALVVVANLLLLIALIRLPHLIELLDSWTFFGIDVGLAVALNLWASWMIPANTLYQVTPYRDLFMPYFWGSVAVWTGIRGAALGAFLVVLAAVPLQLSMAYVNTYRLDITPLAFIDRNMWLLTSYVLAVSALAFAKTAASATAREALRAGREAERAQMLRDMHDTVLQTLEGISLRAGSSDAVAPEERLCEIETAARAQANKIRLALQQDTNRNRLPFATALEQLAREYRAYGIVVKLVSDTVEVEPSASTAAEVLGATREALTNVRKHAHCVRVTVRAVSTADGVRIVVRDYGDGFDPALPSSGYGLGSIERRLTKVGGNVEIWSSVGRGTKVTLWAPN